MELPTFSRHRRDWLELKTIWTSVAESASRKLMSSNDQSEEKLVSKPEAYDTMWQKLESYYEDVDASVQVALDDLHKLKPVSQ